MALKDPNEIYRTDPKALLDPENFTKYEPPKSSPDWMKDALTADELAQKEFEPLAEVVPGLLPEGLAIIGGRPKVGKSWLALDIAISVALGNPVLGREVEAGDVIYCALEDTFPRLQRRQAKLRWPEVGGPKRLLLTHKWRRFDNGGVDDLAQWAELMERPRLAIMDTLAGVRPERLSRDTTYDGDYRALIQLQQLANEKRFCAAVLTHTRKAEADLDPLDAISGTLGIAGCADTILVLKPSNLYVRGRDVEESELAVSFSRDSAKWSILGEAADVRRSDTRKKVLDALEKMGTPMGPKELALATGLKEGTVRQRLLGMVEDGEAVKLGHGRYVLPSNEALS
jgi:AAA domain